jgi:hypothetical protein
MSKRLLQNYCTARIAVAFGSNTLTLLRLRADRQRFGGRGDGPDRSSDINALSGCSNVAET